jgi:LytS/YehU family sensor histidine kinase
VAEMQTLRSQMNPHFMFNALNSINRFILVNDSEKASSYLTLFSRLMRNILENSKLAVIPLKKEIDTLCLYIELESARLEQQFDYRIEFPADHELESAEIPPLVLQPFVENAIWHGLHHKTEQGNLTISIQKAGTDGVFIDIIDDGIGRKASQLQKQHRSGHQSLGIAITIDRIRLLNPENKVEIIDLTDENGRATGTHVRIFLNEQT